VIAIRRAAFPSPRPKRPTSPLSRVRVRVRALSACLAVACITAIATAPADATGLMVFTEEYGGLYLMRDDGTGVTDLTPYCTSRDACAANYPVFSPDGSQIAFATALQSNGEVQDVIALLATNRTTERFISLPANDFADELGFASENTLLFEGFHGFETIPTTGGPSTHLFQSYNDGEFTYECEGPSGEPLGTRCSEQFTEGRSPSPSGNGQVTFLAESGARQPYTLNFFLATDTGADVREITHDNTNATTSQGKPNFTRPLIGRASISPKGTNIVFARYEPLSGPGTGTQIWEAGIDGSDEHELFPVEDSNVFPQPEFSPYETRVAYLDGERLMEADPDGQNRVQLSPPGVHVTGFDWYKKPPADSDGDGIADVADECPTEPGPAPSGCPDSDGDGVPNIHDLCPTIPGTAPDGCPDTDGDGVDDAHDLCPTLYGTLPDGCPAPSVGPGSSTPPLTTMLPPGQNNDPLLAGAGPNSATLQSAIARVCNDAAAAGVGLAGISTIFDWATGGYVSLVDASATFGCSIALPNPDSNVFAEAACGGLTGASVFSGAAGLLAAPSVFGGALLEGISYLTGDLGAWACSADPPDASYREITTAHVIPMRARLPHGISHAQAAPVLALLTDAARARAYGLAMSTCIDRASGAAAAHDSVWASRQHKCAAVNASTLASIFRATIPLLKRIGASLKAASGSHHSIGRSTVLATMTHPSTALRKKLAKAGITPDTLLVAQAAAKHLPQLPSTALSAADGSQTIHAITAAAKAFQQIATENQTAS
jgi:hypothetical protein